MLDLEMINTIFNWSTIGIIALCALMGFFRGTYKSIFYMICTMLIFGIGFIFRENFVNFIINFDVSEYFSFEIQGIKFTSALEFIDLYVAKSFPDYAWALDESTATYQMLYGYVMMVCTSLYLLVLIILAFSVFHIINGFIWLIIRPRKKKQEIIPSSTKKVKEEKDNSSPKITAESEGVYEIKGKEKSKKSSKKEPKKKYKYVRPKKKLYSRFIGLGIGGVKGVFYVLLIGTIFAGIASITDSFMTIVESDITTQNVVILNQEAITVVELEATSTNSQTDEQTNQLQQFAEEYEDIINLITGYRKTVAGKVLGTIKINGNYIDETLFDSIFAVEVDNTKIKFREELKHLVEALSIEGIADILFSGNFSMDQLLNVDKDVLTEFVDTIAKMQLIKVVIPVGIEIMALSDILPETAEFQDIKKLLVENKEELMKLDYTKQISGLGYVFADVLTLIDGDLSQVDYFGFDSETVQNIMTSLGEVEIITIMAPVAVTYIFNIESVKSLLVEWGIDVDNLDYNKVEAAQWKDEFSLIGQMYGDFLNLGITIVDETVNVGQINIDVIDKLCEKIFLSILLKDSIPAIATTALEKVNTVEGFENIIDSSTISDIDWSEELPRLLKATAILAKEGFLSTDVTTEEMLENVGKLSDSTISDVSLYLSESKIVSQNLNNLISILLSQIYTEEIKFDVLDSEAGEEWDQDELQNIFFAVRDLIQLDLISTNVSIDSIKQLDAKPEEVKALSSHISKSKFITKNFNNIFDMITTAIGFDIAKLDYADYNQKEIHSFLSGLVTLSSKIDTESFDINVILDLDDELVNKLLCSKLLTQSIVLNLINIQKEQNSQLEQIKGIMENPEGFYSWYDTVVNVNYTINNNVVTFSSNCEKYVVYLDGFYYKTLETTSFDLPSEYQSDNVQIEIQGITEQGEIRNVIGSLLTLEISSFDPLVINLEKIYESKDKLFKSYIITETIIDVIVNLDPSLGIVVPETLKTGTSSWRDYYDSLNVLHKGELSYLLDGLNSAIDLSTIEDITKLSVDSVNLKNIVNNRTEIFKSEILVATIVKQIQTIDSISMPVEYQTDDLTLWKNSDNNTGELDLILNALDICGIIPETGIDVSVDNIYIEPIVKNQDEILKSVVITETLIEQIKAQEQNGIKIPTEYQTSSDLWKNQYNDEGNVVKRGELSRLLNALEKALGIDSSSDNKTLITGIDVTTISISNITNRTNRNIILRSEVLSYVVEDKIVSLASEQDSQIKLPVNHDDPESPNYIVWKNQYTEDGEIIKENELSHILGALDLISQEDTSFDNFDSINYTALFEEANQDEILKSKVISETIISKITETDVINVPDGYNLKDASDRSAWFNEYSESGQIVARNELANLVRGISELITDKENLSVDSIDYAAIFDEAVQDKLLKSKVISETVITKIEDEAARENSQIHIPDNYNLKLTDNNKRDAWFNEYDENGEVIARNELAHIVGAISELITDRENLSNLSIDSIDYAAIFEEAVQDEILKSKVISETVICKITETDVINVPDGYNLKDTTSRSAWFNQYDENGEVIARNELAHLIGAISVLITDKENLSVDSIDYAAVFDEAVQDEILKSKVISETVICKITETDVINVPDGYNLKLTDNNKRDAWFNQYDENGEVIARNELAHLIGAISELITDKENLSVDSIDYAAVFDEAVQDEILKSKVISETVICKITETDVINVPDGYNLKDTTSRSAWFNEYDENGQVVSRNELAHLIGAISELITDKENLSVDSIDYAAVFDEAVQDEILKSKVISETVICKITETDVINVPDGYNLKLTDNNKRDAWFNEYDENGQVVSRNELAHLIGAISELITDKENLTVDSIDYAAIFDAAVQDEILKSKVISETVICKITETDVINVPDGYNLKLTDNNKRDAWFNEYSESGEVVARNELAHLIGAISELITDKENLTVDSINYAAIFDEDVQDEILKSKVISETIICKITESTVINIPDGYNLKDTTNRSAWFNDYSSNVVVRNELAHLIGAISELITDKENLTVDSINYTAIFDDAIQDEIFKSKVISETVIIKIEEEAASENSQIHIPNNYNLKLTDNNKRDAWFNDYSGDVVVRNELAHLIGAISELITDKETLSIDSINYTAIFDEANQDEILKSKIISETILCKITESTVINIPEGYNLKDANDRSAWFNDYTTDGVVRNELAHLIGAISELITDKENLSVDSIDYTAIFDEVKQDEILKSKVISETILCKITESTVINVPEGYNLKDANDRSAWFNEYSSNVIVRNELAHLIGAISELITDKENLSVDSIDYTAIFDEVKQDEILKSKVISETILCKITASTVINIPDGYNLKDANNRTAWFNDYTTDVVVRNELAHLINGIDILLGTSNDLAIDNIDYTAIFDEAKQDEIFKSKVISETVIIRIEEEAASENSQIHIPNNYNLELTDNNKRDAWFNKYQDGTIEHNELVAFINSINQILDTESKKDFTSINVSSNISKLILGIGSDDAKMQAILRSTIMSETLIANIVDLPAFSSTIDLVEVNVTSGGKVFDNNQARSDWYLLDTQYSINGYREPEEKELWKLLSSISILFGESINIEALDEFKIEHIISNGSLYPTVDETTYDVTSSKVEVILESYIMENIFADILKTSVIPSMESLQDIPTDFAYYRKDITSEYDLLTYIDSLAIFNKYVSYSNPTSAVQTLLIMSNEQIDEMGTGLVISRTFKNSIAKMFNTLFETGYNAKKFLTPSMKNWEEVEFKDEYYKDDNYTLYPNGPSKKESHDHFVDQYNAILVEFNK